MNSAYGGAQIFSLGKVCYLSYRWGHELDTLSTKQTRSVELVCVPAIITMMHYIRLKSKFHHFEGRMGDIF